MTITPFVLDQPFTHGCQYEKVEQFEQPLSGLLWLSGVTDVGVEYWETLGEQIG